MADMKDLKSFPRLEGVGSTPTSGTILGTVKLSGPIDAMEKLYAIALKHLGNNDPDIRWMAVYVTSSLQSAKREVERDRKRNEDTEKRDR